MQSNYDETMEKTAYAGFWARFFAYLIDSVIVWCGLLIVRLFMAGVTAAVSDTVLDGNLLFHYNLTDIVLYIAQVAYFILFTYYTGSTLGKRAMNLRVVPAEEEEHLSFLNVVYRETIGRFLCGVTIGIGYLLVAADKEKRGLHDMLCDTRVVYAKTVKVYPVYYGWNGKRVPKDETISGNVSVPGDVVVPRPVPDEEKAVSKGEKVMQRGDFGGYRMVRPELNPEESGKNGLTEGNWTIEDK